MRILTGISLIFFRLLLVCARLMLVSLFLGAFTCYILSCAVTKFRNHCSVRDYLANTYLNYCKAPLMRLLSPLNKPNLFIHLFK